MQKLRPCLQTHRRKRQYSPGEPKWAFVSIYLYYIM